MKEHDYAYGGRGESLNEHMDREYNEMVACDKAAGEANKLVGRYLKERAADGYAFYTIESINKDGSLVIENTGIYDGWSIPMYEEMSDYFPRQYAIQNISARESTEALFHAMG